MSIIRENLMTIEGYTPYCGDLCSTMPRTKFNGTQFYCPNCNWRSSFPEEFIQKYKTKWIKGEK